MTTSKPFMGGEVGEGKKEFLLSLSILPLSKGGGEGGVFLFPQLEIYFCGKRLYKIKSVGR